ncbi:ATP-binding protein [Herbiconiux sp. 11R-BC]|uniref:sensor histidine kinase n=1 Tax=Herbiconiux sp. 11R-BC TaxID=3111637 RepID=UPI003C079B23
MTLGMPHGSGAESAANALSRATLALGSSALILAAALVALRSINAHGPGPWPALLLLIPIAALMVTTFVRRDLPSMIAYLLLGSASIGVYTAVILHDATNTIADSPYILALPQIAFIYTIAPTVLGARALAFIVAAYVAGQAATLLAALNAGVALSFDFMTAAAAVVITVTSGVSLLLDRRNGRELRTVERALRDTSAMSYQQEIESQVVALFHDTVLSELTVLSHQQPGPLTPAQQAALRRDLAMIADGAWWPDDEAAASPDDGIPPRVAAVLAETRAGGFSVDVAGDLASLHRLTPAVATAVSLALRQALVNARQHSGVQRAEVVVDGAPDAVVVMVSDAGRGFDPAAVPPDRLGVAQSVLARIRDAGGEVQLWTAPGNGTAYMFTLPVAPEHAWEAEE